VTDPAVELGDSVASRDALGYAAIVTSGTPEVDVWALRAATQLAEIGLKRRAL
jgi:hypothetical protein